MQLNSHGGSLTTHKSRTTAIPPKRTANKGWTKHAALRNRGFLFSVVSQKLDGVGFSITLTVKECESPHEWARWKKNFIQTLSDRYDLTRYHMVTEWQRRGAPHLHMAAWFGADTARGFLDREGEEPSVLLGPTEREIWEKAIPQPIHLIKLWRKISALGSPSVLAQDIKEIPDGDALHWLRYLAKHGSRGVSNYQRHAENIPKRWRGETGRVWGKGGKWPIMDPLQVEGISQENKFRLRRLYCSYLRSCSPTHRIKEENKKHVSKYWRDYRKCNERVKSRMRGLSSFIDLEQQFRIIKFVEPEATIFNPVTGEYYETVEELPIDRKSDWKVPQFSPYEHDDWNIIFGHGLNLPSAKPNV